MWIIEVNVVGHRFTHVVPDRRRPSFVSIPAQCTGARRSFATRAA